jgi:hypothetical protein
MDALGRRLQARKKELVEQANRAAERPQFRSFKSTSVVNQFSEEMQPMAQQYSNQGRRDQGRGRNDRERDEQGRFMSDNEDRSWQGQREDDDRYYTSGRDISGREINEQQGRFYGSRERGGYDRDSFEHGETGRGQYRERDEYGRFMSDEDSDYRGGYGNQYGNQGGRESQYGENQYRGERQYGDEEGQWQSGRYRDDRNRDEYGRFSADQDEENRYQGRGDFGRTSHRWDYENESEGRYGRYEDRGQSQGGRGQE